MTTADLFGDVTTCSGDPVRCGAPAVIVGNSGSANKIYRVTSLSPVDPFAEAMSEPVARLTLDERDAERSNQDEMARVASTLQ